MKKVLAVLLIVAIALGTISPVFATEATSVQSTGATLGYSVQSTQTAKGTVTTDLGAEIPVGSTFSVTFDKTSFNWSTTGDNTFAIGNLAATWVKLAGAVIGTDFGIEAIVVDSVTGNAIVTFKALKEYTGTIKVFLDSSGANPTNAIERAVFVKNTPSLITKTKSGGTPPVSTSHSGTVNILTGDRITYRIPGDNFEWSAGNVKDASTLKDTSWIHLNGANIGTDFEVGFTTVPGSTDVTLTLTAVRPANFSSLRLSMQGGGGSATAMSDPLVVNVATSGDGVINGISDTSRLGGYGSGALLNGKSIAYSRLSNLDITPGDEVLLPLTAGFFTWDGNAPYSGAAVTTSQLKRGNITLIVSNRKGGNILASGSPELVQRNGRAYVSIKFDQNVTSTKEVDFSSDIFLAVKRVRHLASGLELMGTLTPDVWTIYDNDSYYDISDGSVVEADGYIRGAELYLGGGVTMYANLYSNKRYSGIATNDITAADQDVLDKFPSIDQIVRIKTNSLNRSTNQVKFDDMGGNFYVYNENGKYLGRTSEKLAYSPIYYLSTKEIDLAGHLNPNSNNDDDDDDTIIIEPDDNYIYDPQSGDATPPNYNDNPGTGF